MVLLMSRKLPRSKKPKSVGLTGGIGSGKSVVAKIFQALQVPIFNSDLRARKILETDPDVRKAIIKLLGDEAYDGSIPQRSFIASRVFENDQLRQELNQIVHPAVGKAFENWVASNSNQDYLIKEAAIVFETGIYKELDATILVTAPKELRISRIRQRDQMKESEIRSRMESQWSDERKLKYADFQISNDPDDALIPQVLKIHEKISGR